MHITGKCNLQMSAKWDGPVLHRDDNCLMTNISFKYVTSVNNGYNMAMNSHGIAKVDLWY